MLPPPVKSTQSSPPSAVSMVGCVVEEQEENQVSSILPGLFTESVCVQPGGRERVGRIRRMLSLLLGSTFQ